MPKIFSPLGVAPAAAVCPYCGASIDRSANQNLEDLPAPGETPCFASAARACWFMTT